MCYLRVSTFVCTFVEQTKKEVNAMQDKLDAAIRFRMSSSSIDKAESLKDKAGFKKKSEVDRMAYIMGLELMMEIERSSKATGVELQRIISERIVSLTRMRHYDEIAAEKQQ